jgi:transposase InsO family protein
MEVMTHNTQLLIATERERWLKLHLEGGMSIQALSGRSGFSRDTLHRWKRAYLKDGLGGLEEKSRAHHSYPGMMPMEIVGRIRTLRMEHGRTGARNIARRLLKRDGLRIHWQTVHKVLRREGLVSHKRLWTKKDRWKPKATVPGELVEVDVAYARKFKGRWLYQFTAIDVCTRWRYLWVTPEQSNRTAVLFLKMLAEKAPFRIRGIKTDNGSIFTNYYTGYKKSADPSHPRLHVFDRTCLALGMTHYLIDPGKPAQNGKVERSHRTDRERFWRIETFTSPSDVKRKLTAYVRWYNEVREHEGIGSLTPMEKLAECQI